MQIRADEVRPESLLSCSLRYFPIKGTLTVANIKEDANVPLQPNFKKTLMHTYSTYLHMGENNYRVYKLYLLECPVYNGSSLGNEKMERIT